MRFWSGIFVILVATLAIPAAIAENSTRVLLVVSSQRGEAENCRYAGNRRFPTGLLLLNAR